MPLAVTARGTISAAVSKVIAAGQHWRCNVCSCELPAAYQIDHIVPLSDGGADSTHNLHALCPNCHAAKTQREHIERRMRSERTSKREAYELREDIFEGGRAMCVVCRRWRPQNAPHPVCWPLENPSTTKSLASLLKFEFVPRR